MTTIMSCHAATWKKLPHAVDNKQRKNRGVKNFTLVASWSNGPLTKIASRMNFGL